MPEEIDPQRRIDTAIRQLGGYWPPLAGLARILEELAELASAQSQRDRSYEAVDCVVAAMAVANQYAVKIYGGQGLTISGGERDALIAAGQIARMVNRIEGSKPPKPVEEGTPSLEKVFSILLGALATTVGTTTSEIIQAAAFAAESNAERDLGRFAPRVDAVTADSRDSFLKATGGVTLGPQVGVWGVDAISKETITPEVLRFLRLDAIHPMNCLVAGPFQSGDADRDLVWQAFSDLTPAKRTTIVQAGNMHFVRLAGTR